MNRNVGAAGRQTQGRLRLIGTQRSSQLLAGQLALHGGWTNEQAEQDGFEYRLIEAGGWELEHMHGVLACLGADGWELDAAYSPEAQAEPGVALQLWLKRELTRPAEVQPARYNPELGTALLAANLAGAGLQGTSQGGRP